MRRSLFFLLLMFTCIISAGAKDNPCLKVTNPSVKDNDWETKLFYRLPQALESGKTYSFSMRIMFNDDYYRDLPFWPCKISSDSSESGTMYEYISGSYEKGKWSTITYDFTTTMEITSLQFAIGLVRGTFYIDDVVLVESGTNKNLVENGTFDEEVTFLTCTGDEAESLVAVESAIAPGTWWSWDVQLPEVTYLTNAPSGTSQTITIDYVTGGDLEGENTCFATKSNTGSNAGEMVWSTYEGVGVNGSKGAEVVCAPGASNGWDAQAWIVFNEEIPEGTTIQISFKCKATKDIRVNTQGHADPGNYLSWNPIGEFDFTTEWQTYEVSFYYSDKDMKSIAFDLAQDLENEVTFYFDDISVKEYKTVTVGKLDADITTFSKSKLSGNEWNFAEPVDLSEYKYMIVTTVQSCGNMPGNMTITDANGVTVGNWDNESSLADNQIVYNKVAAGTRGEMRLDYSNNQNCACINLEYMSTLGLDIKNISKFTVPSAENISAVYLTNYTNGMAVNGYSSNRVGGDYERNYKLLSEGKFGTVALRYTAAVSGAKLYTVDSFNEEEGVMVLAENVDGIVEAGVPYIYEACDFEGAYAADGKKGDNSDVYFFRVDENEASVACTDEEVGNGLVGTYFGLLGFSGDDCYIIKNNRLVKVTSEVNIPLNHCYFDVSKYVGVQDQSTAKLVLGVNSVETGIKNVDKALVEGEIYDINGRKVKSMKNGGMYIMGGMKVYVK